MQQIDELISRLEKATEPDLDLDHAIAAAIMPEDGHGVLLYTASIDAALTLVPKGMWWKVGMDSSGDMPSGERYGYASVKSPRIYEGETPAIALCIAALKARKEESCATNR